MYFKFFNEIYKFLLFFKFSKSFTLLICCGNDVFFVRSNYIFILMTAACSHFSTSSACLFKSCVSSCSPQTSESINCVLIFSLLSLFVLIASPELFSAMKKKTVIKLKSKTSFTKKCYIKHRKSTPSPLFL